MDVHAAQVFFSALALLSAGGSIVLLVASYAAAPRSGVGQTVTAVRESALWLGVLVAATSTVGSLYFSESQHFVPCRLCWFQRIAMYPLTAILLVAAVRRDVSARWYTIPIAAVGAGISTYHSTIEWDPSLEGGSCSLTSPACAQFYFREFGFVTLAFMALCGFVSVIILSALAAVPTPATLAGTDAHRPTVEAIQATKES